MLYALLLKAVLIDLQLKKNICLKALLIYCGRNTGKNFVFMCTFSDGKKSEAIDYIISSDPLINSVYPNWHLDFNYNLSSHKWEFNDNLYKNFWN